jgi:hypothetical protein
MHEESCKKARRTVSGLEAAASLRLCRPFHECSQCIEIALRQLNGETFAAAPTPLVALDAANQPLSENGRSRSAVAYIARLVAAIKLQPE